MSAISATRLLEVVEVALERAPLVASAERAAVLVEEVPPRGSARSGGSFQAKVR